MRLFAPLLAPKLRLSAMTALLVISALSWPAAARQATPDATPASSFFDQDTYDTQLAQLALTPEGPVDQPWLQMIQPELTGTSAYATEPGWHVCFSNASLNNAWRTTGWTTMQAEVELHPEIDTFTVRDAGASDAQQVADIEELLNQDCDVLIISPNTTAALTPAIESACDQVPVIVFDRGVETDCPITFIHPIGGYAYGATGAEFLIDSVPAGGNVLALRRLPGVDVLEHRWAAADIAFQDSDLNIVGVEFTEGDQARVKALVTNYIEQYGQLDGIWLDAGQDAVTVIETFTDLGLTVPPIVGDDKEDFLEAWSTGELAAIGPTYPTYQWRTAVIATTMILTGVEVPAEWVLPQPVITGETLDQYVQPNMPETHYALCGCVDMPGYPERWGGDPAS